ncbi:30S ribosomal protein S20 [Candidatus Falkowbacteria bacterium]|nr:30S ribosomal protein S20 [Candidatus Falkowbacteria bacterium]
MPNLKNAIKQVRKDKKRAAKNLAFRADLKTMIKKARKAILAKEKGVDELLLAIQKKTDKGVQKHIINKNAGSRTLSRLHALKKTTK